MTTIWFDRPNDSRVRAAAFAWLRDQVGQLGDVLPHRLLAQGFILDGRRVPLVGPQGIWKPKVMEVALSITTIEKGPYPDTMEPEGLRYRYRGTDPEHPDNRGLRTAWRHQLPLVYFLGVGDGKYLATWPVFVAADDPANLSVTVAVDAAEYGLKRLEVVEADTPLTDADVIRRQYVTAQVHQRLHQRKFRERVLDAYRRQCAFCRLRHEELLDAAHIVPDTEPEGEPVVQNGLALCKLHHAAFDSMFVGVRPDYVIEVRADILRETDGPTLRHAIQGLHGKVIELPRRADLRPSGGFLVARYERFREAGAA